MTWPVERGSWAAVVMNADGSPGIDVDARAGIATDLLLPIGLGLLGAGLLFGAAATALLVGGLRGPRPVPPPAYRPGGAMPAQPRGPGEHRASGPADGGHLHPLRLDARLDEPLNRWLWLVKWLLAVPHLLVLAVLWPVFCVLTVVAGVAILVTSRYPRTIFAINVGVLRWTWRVTFYAVVLGTDRYPPFSCGRNRATRPTSTSRSRRS